MGIGANCVLITDHGPLNSGYVAAIPDEHKYSLSNKVQPDETQMSGGRQTKTLSGGEKSFSTICLLLALWDAMGTPVRCLDEL